MFGEILVPEIWAEIFLANQIAGSFNHVFGTKNEITLFFAC